MRDNFSPNTKKIIAQRVGFRCSNPKCSRLTTGPQIDVTKSVNLGVCAHITAAAPGGPRYDPNLTSEERKSPKNAIWLCQFCAKLVDNDELKYPEEKLFKWKVSSEDQAHKEIDKLINDLAKSKAGIEWTWDKEKSTYTNLQTGEIVNPRKIIEIRDLYLDNVKSSIDSSIDNLFDEDMLLQDWQLDFLKELKYTCINCFALAIGGHGYLTDSINKEIGIVVKNIAQLLDNFSVDLAEGKYHHNDIAWGKEHAKLRAISFVDSVKDVVDWP